MEEKQKRKRWQGEEIVGVLRRYLKEGAKLSEVCEAAGCSPTQVLQWEKRLFESGAKVFERKKAEAREAEAVREQVAALETKLRRKDAVLAELMEEHVALKKTAGDPSGAGGFLRTSGTRSSIS